jgi:flavodoxin
MRMEILYHSITGNTKKVAESISDVLGIKAKNIKEDFVLKDFDILFLGSGVYAGKMSKHLSNFAENTKGLEGKKVALFATYGGDREAIDVMKDFLKSKNLKVIDTWGCEGRFLVANRGKPDETDLENVKGWAKKLVNHKH